MALDDAYAHCAALVRAADKDRYLAALFAPEERRKHLYALYAFAAEIARVREAAREPMPGELRLQWWRDALAGPVEAAAHPVVAALLDTIAACALPAGVLIALIDARTFDLYEDVMATLGDLEIYVQATAGALFALGGKILGGEAAAASVNTAATLAGIAYGLTQVLGSLSHDRARGQSYVPIDLLREHGTTREAIEAGQATPGLRNALAALRIRALTAYDQFRTSVRALPDAVAPAFLTIALVPLWLDRLRRSEDPFTPVEIAQWRRQWRMLRAARQWPNV